MLSWKTRLRSAGAENAAVLLLCTVLGGCDGSSGWPPAPVPAANHTIGGSVSGLVSGESVTLANNGADALEITANGPFEFSSPVSASGSYSVTVETQPLGATCTVSNGSGAGVTQDVTNVAVTCSAETFTIAGNVAGLEEGAEVVLQNNGADDLAISADGAFAFGTPVAYDGSYAVTVATQPAGATCTVSQGTGAGVTQDVTDVSVTCSTNTYAIGGTLSGLGAGLQLTLLNNAADPLILAADGSFTFPTAVADQGSYHVTVGTQPVGQTCTVIDGQGTDLETNVSNVSVLCSTDTYTIGGTLSGLVLGAQVTLNNNGADPLTLTAVGAFTFTTPVVHDGAYAVTVGTQPDDQVCFVTNGTGNNLSADVVDVSVDCVDSVASFTAPGSYTYSVPAGVSSLEIVTTGGGGGGAGMHGTNPGQPGGAGAVVETMLSVTPGQVLQLVVGSGGGAGANGPGDSSSWTCGAGGGGGGASHVDAGTATQIIAGGGGGGGGCNNGTAGGSGGESDGSGGHGGDYFWRTGGRGGSGSFGGAGGQDTFMGQAESGSDGDGGSGGVGGSNGFSGMYPGGAGGTSAGTGAGGNADGQLAGGGGGGYGGGGAGISATGGGAGGSTGPLGSVYSAGSNGGASATAGGDGSIVITVQP
jgi:hypothetical protein